MAEAYANFSAELGPGAMALYLGSEPVFAWDTLWFKECVSFDLIDDGPRMKRCIEQIDDLYFTYYNAMYDIVKAADGSSSYISLADGTLDDGIRAADRLVNRLGSDGLYLLFHYDISETAGRRLIEHAEKHWG